MKVTVLADWREGSLDIHEDIFVTDQKQPLSDILILNHNTLKLSLIISLSKRGKCRYNESLNVYLNLLRGRTSDSKSAKKNCRFVCYLNPVIKPGVAVAGEEAHQVE